MSSGRPQEAFGSDFVRISEAFPSNAMRPRRPQLQAPGAAAQRLRKGISDRTGLLSRSSGGSRHSRLAAVRCLVAPALAVLAALSALALLAMLARPPASRASRSMIARFIFGAKNDECFERGRFFTKIRSPRWAPGSVGVPEASRERFWSHFGSILEPFWSPQDPF